MKIAVIGTGYVGLVTGTCFAESGNEVICVDIDQEKLRKLNAGIVPIYEPGLEVIFKRNIEEGRLTFTSNLAEAILVSELIFLALPTPPQEDGSADLQYVLKVTEEMAGILTEDSGFKLVVNKSTVPVGTCAKVLSTFKAKSKADIEVISNPEFLREGAAVDDFMKPERVVVGCSSERAVKLMTHLYKPFLMSGNPIVFMDERSSELTKYAANSFLAMKISYMNEMALLCEKLGANVDMVRKGIGSDSRIGKRFLFPGVGYGGSCFPKDVKALSYTAKENAYDFAILNAVMSVNEKQKKVLVTKVLDFYNQDIKGKKLAVWGLAFKPNTDDIREAPSLEIISNLLDKGAEIIAFDPEAMHEYQKYHPELSIKYCDSHYDTLAGADALLIITEWNMFRTPDFARMKSLMAHPVIFDGRNVFDSSEMQESGFQYTSIGRPTIGLQA